MHPKGWTLDSDLVRHEPGTVHTSMCSGVPFVGVGMMPEQDLNIRLAVNKGRRAARCTHFIADIAPDFCTLLLPHLWKTCFLRDLGGLCFWGNMASALDEAHIDAFFGEKTVGSLECWNQRLSSPNMPRCLHQIC